MPLVAHNQLPSFSRLEYEGIKILTPETAQHQDIRELHIGLLNMMPDAALTATERQFFRLIGESNPIAQFYVHPFTLDEIPRSDKAKEYLSQYYESFSDIREMGLDALIITGANVTGSNLSSQPFWEPLIEVIDWAWDNVTSTLCSCLATHAVMEFRYGQKRILQDSKTWGVFPHHLLDKDREKQHPLINDINTRFDVPHSRWNAITANQFKQQNLKILVKSDDDMVHLATSPDGFRQILFQGHPEYDTISLLKEYKREVLQYYQGNIKHYPPFPKHYFGHFEKAILNEYRFRCDRAQLQRTEMPDFPEALISKNIDITWHDTAVEVIGNWMGLIYQLTHKDRHIAFMDDIDPENPLEL